MPNNLIPNPNYNPALEATATNQPYLFEKPEETVISPLTGQTASQAAITSESLMPAKSIEIPKLSEDTTNYSGIISGGQNLTQNLILPETPIDNTDIMNQINKLLGEAPPSGATTYESTYGVGPTQAEVSTKEQDLIAKQGVQKQAQNEFNAINAQIQALNLEAQTIPVKLQQEATGRGITTGGLAPIQTAQLRDVALRSLPLQGQALVAQAKILTAQGDVQTAQLLYDSAQKKFDKIFELRIADMTNMYNYRKDMRDKVWNYLSAKEKERVDALQKEDDRKFDLLKLNIANAKDLAKTALENGQAALAGQITQLDPKSDTFTQDLATLQGQIKVKTEEQGAVSNLATKYPDAGITLTDTLAVAQGKLSKSRIYQEQVRPPVSLTTAALKGTTGASYESRLDQEIVNLYNGRYGTEEAREQVVKMLETEFPGRDVAKDIYNRAPDGWEARMKKPTENEPTAWEVDAGIWQWLATDGANLSDEEKKQQIIQMGRNPENFGIY